jgi:hypothetical protein
MKTDRFQDYKSPVIYAIAVVAVIVFCVIGWAIRDTDIKIAAHEAEIERLQAEKAQIILNYQNRKSKIVNFYKPN